MLALDKKIVARARVVWLSVLKPLSQANFREAVKQGHCLFLMRVFLFSVFFSAPPAMNKAAHVCPFLLLSCKSRHSHYQNICFSYSVPGAAKKKLSPPQFTAAVEGFCLENATPPLPPGLGF